GLERSAQFHHAAFLVQGLRDLQGVSYADHDLELGNQPAPKRQRDGVARIFPTPNLTGLPLLNEAGSLVQQQADFREQFPAIDENRRAIPGAVQRLEDFVVQSDKSLM